MPPLDDGLSPNECHAARFLHADGWTYQDIRSLLMVSKTTVEMHLSDSCGCPPLTEPQEPENVSPSIIKRRRNLLGLSQQELADRVGVPHSSVSYWESGERSPNVENAWSLVRELNLHV